MPKLQSVRNKTSTKMPMPHHTVSILIAYIEAYIGRLGDDQALMEQLRRIEIHISPNILSSTRHTMRRELQEFDLPFLHGMITKFASMVISIQTNDCSDMVSAVKTFLDIMPVPLPARAIRQRPADHHGYPNRPSSIVSFDIEGHTPSQSSIGSSMSSLSSVFVSSVYATPDASSADTHRATPEGEADGDPIQVVLVCPPPTPDSGDSDSMSRETGDGAYNDD